MINRLLQFCILSKKVNLEILIYNKIVFDSNTNDRKWEEAEHNNRWGLYMFSFSTSSLS